MTLSDIQVCGAVGAPRRSDALFNSSVHTPLDAQAAANCRCVPCVLQLPEDTVWQLSDEPHAALNLAVNQVAVTCECRTGPVPACGKAVPEWLSLLPAITLELLPVVSRCVLLTSTSNDTANYPGHAEAHSSPKLHVTGY